MAHSGTEHSLGTEVSREMQVIPWDLDIPEPPERVLEWPDSLDVGEPINLGPGDPAEVACAQITAGFDALMALAPELVANLSVTRTVDALMDAQSRTAGLLDRFVHQIDLRGLTIGTGARTTAAWLRHRYRLDARPARTLADRAYAGNDQLPPLGEAMAGGRVHPDQAATIIKGMGGLPPTTTADQREALLEELIGRCESDDPLALGKVAVARAEELTLISEDGEPPDDSDPAAYERRSATLRRRDGGWEARIFAPGESGAVLAEFIDARSHLDDATHGDPEHPEGRDTRTTDQRRFDALAEAWEHSATCAAQPAPPVPGILVALDYDALTRTLSGATLLGTGQRLPASVARRLCCEGALIPTVLDGQSQVLDLGRDQRLFTGPQRKALAIRDGGCSFPGCDEPPARCHAHHLTEWFYGGKTDLCNGALLCGRHHRQLHRHGWTGRMAANGHPEYLPPPWIDPAQTPRQHHRFHQVSAAGRR